MKPLDEYTTDEIRSLEAGGELDALVAQVVGTMEDDNYDYISGPLQYSGGSDGECWDVMEAFLTEFVDTSLMTSEESATATVFVGEVPLSATASTAQVAICRVILLAAKVAPEKTEVEVTTEHGLKPVRYEAAGTTRASPSIGVVIEQIKRQCDKTREHDGCSSTTVRMWVLRRALGYLLKIKEAEVPIRQGEGERVNGDND